jgi:hypothetical protein
MGKVKTTASVFELPQKLGILQYVEYEPERCYGCLYTGLLTVEGCKRGICVRYRVWVTSKDMRKWEAVKVRQRDDDEMGGCLKQQVADAVLELAERGHSVEINDKCDIIIDGVTISRPRCRSADECVKEMLEERRRRLETPQPPPRSPEEEEYEALAQQYAWLRWWGRDVVLDILRHNRRYLLDLLQRINSTDIPHFIVAFLGRFNVDWRCLVEIYRGNDGYCVSFCIKDTVPTPTTYCYENGKGWFHAQQPKFLRLSKLQEIYVVGDKEMVRVV